MNELGLISLVVLVGLFLFNVWQLLFLNPASKENNDGLQKWKLGLFVIALSSIVFFVYVTGSINSIGDQQTIDNGTTTYVVKSNEYQELFAYLPLAVALYVCQWGILFIQIIQGTSFFGRPRMDGRME